MTQSNRTMKVTCALELVVDLEQQFSARGNFCPQRGYLTMPSDIFDCCNYGRVGFLLLSSGMLLNILQCSGKSQSPTKSYLPKMSIVFKLGNPGLGRKDQKREQSESETDRFLWLLLSVLSGGELLCWVVTMDSYSG